MTRRNLIASAAITAASYSRVLGANDRLSVALIGCGARGGQLQTAFDKLNGPFAALCDVYQARALRMQHVCPEAKLFGDHRKVLEMPGLDAVVVAAPDHWHAQIAIDALNAGKDVYVEKPLTLRMEEGPQIIRAARMNERICQTGAQQRSGTHYIQARDEYLRKKRLGKINLVRTWWFDGGGQIRSAEAAAARPANPNDPFRGHGVPKGMENKPADLDWNRYLGAVKWRAWDPPQFFNFRNYMDFNGGIMTDKFVHWVDVVHMFMGQDGPISADAAGGIYISQDGRTVPDTLNVHLEYPGNWICTYSNTPQARLEREGIEFCGTDGHLFINRLKFEYFAADGADSVTVTCQTDLVDEHVQNFLDCCRSRRTPNGDVAAGHRSAQAAHLANLSYLQRRRIHFDPDRELVLPL
jgi:predicted dehydrogenase